MSARSHQRRRILTDLWTALERTGTRTFAGFVVDRNSPEKTFVVEVLLDGEVVFVLLACEYCETVQAAGCRNGNYGFSFTLSADQVSNGTSVEARLSNIGTFVGESIALLSSYGERSSFAVLPRNQVDWMGGLKLSGWIKAAGTTDRSASPVVTARIEDRLVARVRPSAWRHVKEAETGAGPAHAFDLHLPAEFADGRIHRVHVRSGEYELKGSPVTFIAFADGLASFLPRDPGADEHDWKRARFFDHIMPMSAPFGDYPWWCARFGMAEAPTEPHSTIAVALVGDDNARTSESLEKQTHQDWVAAVFPGDDGQLTFDPDALLAFLTEEARESDLVLLAPAGTDFDESALLKLNAAFLAHPEAIAVYGDVDIKDQAGRAWPLFFPAFDYERFLEQGYCAFLFAARRSHVEQAIEAGASDLFQVFLALLEDGPIDPSRIVHVPGALGSLPPFDRASAADRLARAVRRRLAADGVTAVVTPWLGSHLPAVRVSRTVTCSPRSVSIIIPTRNRVELLRPCLKSIAGAGVEHIAEIIIIDNDSSDPETLDFLADQERSGYVRVLRIPGPFNFSRLNNEAVASARAPHICLMNNDIEVLSPDWLGEMLGRLADPDVGAAGPLLLWPSGVVQHGGVVLGTSFAADHAFTDRLADDLGYCDLLRVARQCSAVTAACLLTRKADFIAVGGLDEHFFPVNFNDVDYCLRLRARGKRVVFTPHARLLHHESVSRGLDDRPDRVSRARREAAALRSRWSDTLLNDPFYSPALALDPKPFTGLAWPPRPMVPRTSAPPVAVELPPGF